ncbi:MAG: hypothetical protein KDD94_07245, partial [Calditrichaeota bacterium]|nr:hypothetical protein [Calditrichota bacterium]
WEEFMVDKGVGLSSLKEPEKKKDENKDVDEREKFLKYKDRDDYFNKRSNPGAYYEVIIDDSHPLSVGVQSPFHVLKTDRTIFELNKSTQNIAYFTDKNILGFSPKSVRESINKTAFFSDETYRSGKVTMINADPTYRMFQMGSTKLLLNAVYFGMLRF